LGFSSPVGAPGQGPALQRGRWVVCDRFADSTRIYQGVLGKVDPIFVEDINDMPETIMTMAKNGDVVITMGAGSISAVPAKLTQAVTQSV